MKAEELELQLEELAGPLHARITMALSQHPDGLRVSQLRGIPGLTEFSSPKITRELQTMERFGQVEKKPRRAYRDQSSWPRTWRLTDQGWRDLAAVPDCFALVKDGAER